MKHASILPLLVSVLLAACGAADESSSASSGGALERRGATEQEQAIVVMQDPAVKQAPAAEVPPPGTPRADLPTQISAADSGGVPPLPGQPSVSLNPMLIRTGTATIEVDSLEHGIAQLRALAQRVGGLVGNTSISSGAEEARRATVELRIPSASFDRTVSGLAPVGRVEHVNISAEDVGEEYTDVTARVANARRLESRLLDLLDRRTGRLEEVLNLERELARVREEIERYEGRLRYLRTRSSISLLTVTLHEPGSVLSPGDRPIRDAFGQAWRNLVGLIAGLIAASGVLIPLALLAYALWRAFRWVRRRDRERDAAYRETLRRERERKTPPEEPVVRG
jgi:hypothetical protein